MKKKQQDIIFFEMFHGTEDKNLVLQLQQLIEGNGHYQGLYIRDVTQVTDRNATLNKRKILDPLFSCQPDGVFVAGKHITKSMIEQASLSNPKLITSQLLRLHVDLVQHIVKKVMAIASKFCNSTTKQDEWSLLSGCSFADLYEHVLAKMFQLLHIEGSHNNNSEGDNKEETEPQEEIEKEERPCEWFFPGYFSSILFTFFRRMLLGASTCFGLWRIKIKPAVKPP